MQHAYKLGKANRRPGQTTGQYVREQLDRLGLGRELKGIQWGSGRPAPERSRVLMLPRADARPDAPAGQLPPGPLDKPSHLCVGTPLATGGGAADGVLAVDRDALDRALLGEGT